MKESEPLSAEQVSKLIQEYLQKYPEVGGVRGLSKKTGLSYDSVQKYAKGSNLPPPQKWALLWSVISSPPDLTATRSSLFDQRSESEAMTENKETGNRIDSTKEKDISRLG